MVEGGGRTRKSYGGRRTAEGEMFLLLFSITRLEQVLSLELKRQYTLLEFELQTAWPPRPRSIKFNVNCIDYSIIVYNVNN